MLNFAIEMNIYMTLQTEYKRSSFEKIGGGGNILPIRFFQTKRKLALQNFWVTLLMISISGIPAN